MAGNTRYSVLPAILIRLPCIFSCQLRNQVADIRKLELARFKIFTKDLLAVLGKILDVDKRSQSSSEIETLDSFPSSLAQVLENLLSSGLFVFIREPKILRSLTTADCALPEFVGAQITDGSTHEHHGRLAIITLHFVAPLGPEL